MLFPPFMMNARRRRYWIHFTDGKTEAQAGNGLAHGHTAGKPRISDLKPTLVSLCQMPLISAEGPIVHPSAPPPAPPIIKEHMLMIEDSEKAEKYEKVKITRNGSSRNFKKY